MPSRNDPPPVYSTKDPSSARTGGFSNQRQNLYPQSGRASRGGRNGPSNQYTFEETTHTTKHIHIVNDPPTPARAPMPTRAPMPERAPLLPQHQQHVNPRQDRRLSISSVLMLMAGLCGITYIVFNASGASITFDPPPAPHWNIPTPGKCVKYGTRSYQAYLLNPGTQGLQACQNTSLVWKDVTLTHPDACYVTANGVVGQWNVTFDEVECSPGWGKFFDKDCGLIESRLWSLPDNEDWMLLCRTTPATINGRYFARPDYCRNDWSGVHGYWHTDDSLCKGLVGGEHDIPFDETLANESVDAEAVADKE